MDMGLHKMIHCGHRFPRECVVNQRNLCDGEPEETMECNGETCPSLTEWSEWTDCTKTCDGGTQRRVRDCLVQRSGVGNACFEPLEESKGF